MSRRLIHASAVVVAAAISSLLIALPAAANDGSCEATGWLGCAISNDGSGVTIGGSISTPGAPPQGGGGHGGSGQNGGGSGGGGEGPPVAEAAPVVVTDPRWGPCRDDQVSPRADGLCWQDWAAEDAEEAAGPEAPVIPAVTVSDVARFAPATPAVRTEPDGVAIVGMPMNVVVAASTQTVAGQLFGLPVSVTFEPVEAVLDYGDGTRQTVPIGGGTWEQLGQPEFTPTATSHAYGARGTYTVSATIMSAAVADFGVWGTRPVEGLVASAPSTTSVQAVTADTGLVQFTCAENPSGPGC